MGEPTLRFSGTPYGEYTMNTDYKKGGINDMDTEKYLERLDQDRRESEQRLRDERKESEQRSRDMEERINKRTEEFEKRLDERFTHIDNRFERIENKIDGTLKDVRQDNKDTRRWIAGLCITTIIGISTMALAVGALIVTVILNNAQNIPL